MWVLNFIPDWFFYLLLIIGIVGIIASYLFKFIPFIYMYKTPLQITSVVVIAFSVFMIGATVNENTWKEKVAELEKKVIEAEAQAGKVTTEVVTQYVTKKEVIREKGKDIIQVIEKEVVKLNDVCKLTPDVIKIHNSSALMVENKK
jgi:hypothetical protein